MNLASSFFSLSFFMETAEESDHSLPMLKVLVHQIIAANCSSETHKTARTDFEFCALRSKRAKDLV